VLYDREMPTQEQSYYKVTEDEIRQSRGRHLELCWQKLCEYSEYVEAIDAAGNLDSAMECGAVNPHYFFFHRAYFEALWYGRAPWMSTAK
jgi:hypothetical protein